MRHVTYYHKDTGRLHLWSHLVSDDRAVVLNTPLDHYPIDHPIGAMWHPLKHRVDVERLAREDSDALTVWAAQTADENKITTPRPLPPVATAAHVLDYQPPAPSLDHVWDDNEKCWVLSNAAKVVERQQRVAQVRRRELEKAERPLLRRLTLNPQDEAAREALQQIDAEFSLLNLNVGPAHE